MDEQVLNETTAVATGSAFGAFMATLGIFAIVCIIAWYLLQVIAYWRIFTKAGRPGWHSIIPILNEWDRTDLSWNRTMAWVMLACMILAGICSAFGTSVNSDGVVYRNALGTIGYIISIAGAILAIISEYKLAKAFGKGFGFFLGLLFLNPIFKLILGFGDAQYQGPQG